MAIRFKFASLRKTGPKDLIVRFIFGGTVTLMAGILAQKYGPAVGGLFLAFPAIFPASITLIAKHEEQRKGMKGQDGRRRGQQAAALDARGAIIGACALFVFALAVRWLLPNVSAPIALGLATLGWLAFSVLIWWVS